MKPIKAHYVQEDEGLETYDAVKVEAQKMISGADGFVVFAAYVDANDSYAVRMAGGVRNIPAPELLKLVRMKVRELERQARRDWPGGTDGLAD